MLSVTQQWQDASKGKYTSLNSRASRQYQMSFVLTNCGAVRGIYSNNPWSTPPYGILQLYIIDFHPDEYSMCNILSQNKRLWSWLWNKSTISDSTNLPWGCQSSSASYNTYNTTTREIPRFCMRAMTSCHDINVRCSSSKSMRAE